MEERTKIYYFFDSEGDLCILYSDFTAEKANILPSQEMFIVDSTYYDTLEGHK